MNCNALFGLAATIGKTLNFVVWKLLWAMEILLNLDVTAVRSFRRIAAAHLSLPEETV